MVSFKDLNPRYHQEYWEEHFAEIYDLLVQVNNEVLDGWGEIEENKEPPSQHRTAFYYPQNITLFSWGSPDTYLAITPGKEIDSFKILLSQRGNLIFSGECKLSQIVTWLRRGLEVGLAKGFAHAFPYDQEERQQKMLQEMEEKMEEAMWREGLETYFNDLAEFYDEDGC